MLSGFPLQDICRLNATGITVQELRDSSPCRLLVRLAVGIDSQSIIRDDNRTRVRRVNVKFHLAGGGCDFISACGAHQGIERIADKMLSRDAFGRVLASCIFRTGLGSSDATQTYSQFSKKTVWEYLTTLLRFESALQDSHW
jgi:hypothetical protein